MQRKIKLLITFFIVCLYNIQKVDAQILEYSTNISIENNEKITEKSYLIKINNKLESNLSKVSIRYNPNQKFTLVDAKVIDSNGDIVKRLKKDDVIKKNYFSDTSFYVDDLVNEFDLFWNTYPYLISYTYKIVDNEFFNIINWYPVVYLGVESQKNNLTIKVPIDYEIAYDYSKNINFSEEISELYKTCHWTFENYIPYNEEIYGPSLFEIIPKVHIVPKNFYYGVNGSANNWGEFGLWQDDLNYSMDNLPNTEKKIIDRLINGISDKSEIIRVLYEYLQDKTQYVNVDIDVGGLRSYSASYVAKNKYGDCKALTTFMKAMLNYTGIESYYTLIKAGENSGDINTEFPSQQFNHAILMVPMQNDTIWLENTSNSLPFNYLGVFTQDRKALMINGSKSQLVKTPKLTIDDVTEKNNLKFVVNNNLWKFSFTEELKGEKFEKYRYYKREKSIDDQKEFILKNIPIDRFNIDNFQIKDKKRSNTFLNVEVTGDCQPQIKKISHLRVIKPLKISIPKFETPQKRQFNVRINYPIHKENSVEYDFTLLSEKMTFELPENLDIISDFGEYQTSYTVTNNKLIVTEKFVLNSGTYKIDRYKDFYKFIKDIKNHKQSSSIILK